ncbi:hypothetical protein [Streptomyces sp. NPDC007205]|uniref:hypothetical protein n=1 Tax=Streptomyces sp. NPDC007205 TaxID=3154316 RepID=UPI0033DF8B1D
MKAANISRLLTPPLVLGLVVTAPGVPVASATPAKAVDRQTWQVRFIALTNADDGRTVRVSAGDKIRVRLTGSSEQGITWAWSEPEVSAPGDLKHIEGGETPTGDATSLFRATRIGQSQIISQRSCTADPGQMCPDSILPWKVTIKVVR